MTNLSSIGCFREGVGLFCTVQEDPALQKMVAVQWLVVKNHYICTFIYCGRNSKKCHSDGKSVLSRLLPLNLGVSTLSNCCYG